MCARELFARESVARSSRRVDCLRFVRGWTGCEGEGEAGEGSGGGGRSALDGGSSAFYGGQQWMATALHLTHD